MTTDLPPAGADSAEDRRYMQLALNLGRRGLGRTWPNPAVGCVLVKDGIIIGRGWTQPGGRPHAETEALKQARRGQARGATLYTTLEPCSHQGQTPPCADALIAAGVARVVSAMEDPNPEVAGQGHARLRDRNIAVEIGLCEAEARLAHAGHIRRIRDGRPHVMLKMAVSSDGKIAAGVRKRVEITGEAARERVFQMRATSDAILVGKGTVLADDPALTCRLPGMESWSPVRVVLNAKMNVPLASAVIATARETPSWLVGSTAASAIAEEVLRGKGVEVLRAEAPDGLFDLQAVMKMLAGRGITRLMVEGGASVAAALLKADLIDEVLLFHGPKPIGDDGLGALDGLPLSALTQAPNLHLVASEQVGEDRLDHLVRR
ncbi:MAG TPA: bifunctional diaminohydroxyphosphoribosylaminopyrimidine deaminase/5-amino-6-(5-phosphoribosylamino)uracil reductase RibD [Pseudolabrys sp.]|nr:bifunctional diaminohydroxyphosphoribosylaminopyrimidine deaminase/5-amino-6-(5-phosphoribosylamino)uracil reductase RibD [Pseudolabrys sp.]